MNDQISSHTTTGPKVAGLLVTMFLAGYVFLGAFCPLWETLFYSPRLRHFLIITSITMFIISLPIFIIALVSHSTQLRAISEEEERKRAAAWQRAMATWRSNLQTGTTHSRNSAQHLSEEELELFATRLFEAMGYQVIHSGQTGDHGVDVRLVTPDKRIEVVQCKQWDKPVGEAQVRDLYGVLLHEKAARAWLLAPRGFSGPAKRWAMGKSIELVDDKAIGRLVECAFGQVVVPSAEPVECASGLTEVQSAKPVMRPSMVFCLHDGTQIRALSVIDMGSYYSIEDIEGNTHNVPKGQVRETLCP